MPGGRSTPTMWPPCSGCPSRAGFPSGRRSPGPSMRACSAISCPRPSPPPPAWCSTGSPAWPTGDGRHDEYWKFIRPRNNSMNFQYSPEVLESLLADPDVSEILLNGGGQAFVERSGRLEAVSVDLDEAGVRRVVERIIAPLGLRFDRSSPLVDARLP